ncbi:MAG: hypothetical protein P4M11_09085 [Candidatus Pacebacteria bacterium]|nr:hypothetical protein [Candidatus Paceibacterota bacterium]
MPSAKKGKLFSSSDDATLQNEEETKVYQHPPLSIVVLSERESVGCGGGSAHVQCSI